MAPRHHPALTAGDACPGCGATLSLYVNGIDSQELRRKANEIGKPVIAPLKVLRCPTKKAICGKNEIVLETIRFLPDTTHRQETLL